MREGMMDDCGYHGFEECFRYEDCCKDAYEQGRLDVAQDLLDIFDYDLFLAYSNDDRFISFNNLSLMIRDIAYELKEQSHDN